MYNFSYIPPNWIGIELYITKRNLCRSDAYAHKTNDQFSPSKNSEQNLAEY